MFLEMLLVEGKSKIRISRCYLKFVSNETLRFEFKARRKFFKSRIAVTDTYNVTCVSYNSTKKLGSDYKTEVINFR